MTKPPQDPGSGPRIRARARGGSSSMRPEVVDALGGVERSLSEVAKWEQMLAGRPEGGPVIPALPEGYVGLATEELAPPGEPGPEVEPEPPTPDEEEVPAVREIGLLDAVREAEEGAEEDDEPQDAAAAADALVAPLLTEFKPEDTAIHQPDASVLWAARTVESPTGEPNEEVLARRRRHARILSWAGALVLVAGAALWLVPDRSSDDDGDQQLPALEVTSTTKSRTQILDQTGTTATTVPPATTTPTVTATTRRSTPTTARSTPTTQAPTPTAAPGTTLPLPGPPGPVNPSRTVPTTPPTTAATTTTTIAATDGGTGGPTTG